MTHGDLTASFTGVDENFGLLLKTDSTTALIHWTDLLEPASLMILYSSPGHSTFDGNADRNVFHSPALRAKVRIRGFEFSNWSQG